MATIIDGTAVSAAVRARVTEGVEELVGRTGHTPGLGRMCAAMPMRQGLGLTRARKHCWVRHMRA